MSPKLSLSLALILAAALPASAKEQTYRRVLVCAGPDASMEVYLPEGLVSGSGVDNVKLDKPATGLYALDLSGAGKGKVLEPVRVSLEDKGETLVVDQFTRGLKPTRVPVAGGTVDFDNRFATKAQCAAFNEDPEIE
jgi:hypothetical protein